MNKDELIYEVAKYLMIKTRGYTSENDWPIEWDTTREDSQISIVIDDVREMLRYLESNHGYSFPKKDAPTQVPLTGSAAYSVTYNNTTWGPSVGTGGGNGAGGVGWTTFSNVKNQEEVLTSVKIHLSTPHQSTLGDIEEFVQRAKEMGLSESSEITGRLQAHVSLNDTDVSLISCGDCGKDDLLITQHSCELPNSPYNK